MANTKLSLEAKDCAIKLAQAKDLAADIQIDKSVLTGSEIERQRTATCHSIKVSSESRVTSIQNAAVQNEEDIRTLMSERIDLADKHLKVQIFNIDYENNERKKENHKQSEIKVKTMIQKVCVNKKVKVHCCQPLLCASKT